MNIYSILYFLSFLTIHAIAMDTNQANQIVYKVFFNDNNEDECFVGDKGRLIGINSPEKNPLVSFNPQTSYLNFNKSHINIPFNCFAKVKDDIIYGVRVNNNFYVNGHPIDLKSIICDDDETHNKRYTVLLKNLDIMILAPLCTFIEDPNLASTICLETSKHVLSKLHIIEHNYPNSLKIKLIHITPQYGTKFITNKPIMCYVPVGTQTFRNYEEYSNRGK